MKAENDIERDEIRREEKNAQMFKFTKMSKKQPFFPTLKTRGTIQVEYVKSLDNSLKYVPGREKEALMFPARNTDNSKKFAELGTAPGGFFKREVGQELDKIDAVMRKYMTSRERGLIKPRRGSEPGVSIPVPKETAWLEGTNGSVIPASHYPDILSNVPGLNDRTMTPRGTQRAISLSRNSTNKRWLYNKTTLDPFSPNASKLEV